MFKSKTFHQKIFFFLFFVVFLLSSCSHVQPKWPLDSDLSCYIQPKADATTGHQQHGLHHAKKEKEDEHEKNKKPLSSEPNFSSTEVWDFKSVSDPKLLQKTLKLFEQGHIGTRVKMLRLKDLSAEKIHCTLTRMGFRHQRIPLSVHPVFKPDFFWLKSGISAKVNPSSKEVVPMDIYDHQDGSVVRIRAWGIPDRTQKTIRPQPTVIKSVVFDLKQHCHFLGLFDCHLDTSWQNEAFKVTEGGTALPKSPLPAHGFLIPEKLSTKEEKMAYTDHMMGQVHLDLPVSFKHCHNLK